MDCTYKLGVSQVSPLPWLPQLEIRICAAMAARRGGLMLREEIPHYAGVALVGLITGFAGYAIAKLASLLLLR